MRTKPIEFEVAKGTKELLLCIAELKKKNAELEAQIEKMKNCGNCDGILYGGRRTEKCRHCMNGKELSEWRLAND